MIEHVFDPANNLSAVSVKVEPGAVFIGPTNFIDLESVSALQLSPIQLSLLIVALQRAQAIGAQQPAGTEEAQRAEHPQEGH